MQRKRHHARHSEKGERLSEKDYQMSMTREEIIGRAQECIDLLVRPPFANPVVIRLDTTFKEDLGCSLDMKTDIVLDLEDEFGVILTGGLEAKTFGELLEIIIEKLNEEHLVTGFMKRINT